MLGAFVIDNNRQQHVDPSIHSANDTNNNNSKRDRTPVEVELVSVNDGSVPLSQITNPSAMANHRATHGPNAREDVVEQGANRGNDDQFVILQQQ